jgi:hypothetical protein
VRRRWESPKGRVDVEKGLVVVLTSEVQVEKMECAGTGQVEVEKALSWPAILPEA